MYGFEKPRGKEHAMQMRSILINIQPTTYMIDPLSTDDGMTRLKKL